MTNDPEHPDVEADDLEEAASDEPQDSAAEALSAELQALAPEQLREMLAETQVALSLAEMQRDEHLADLQRKAAELSNVLKREQRTAGAGRVEGRIDVMRVLLDVLDDFDRTAQAATASPDEGLRSGVGLVRDKLAGALAGQGLVRCGEVGEPFDPNHHEAIQQVDGDEPLEHPVVHEVFRPGYRVGERILRPAMVIVRQ